MDGHTQMRKFSVTFVLKVDDDNNIFSALEEAHVDDIYDLIRNTFYDIDDVRGRQLKY